MQLVIGNDDKFLDASTNKSGRVDGFRTADFQDIENIEMDEEYHFIQTDAEIDNAADSDSHPVKNNRLSETENH
jgi:hypothetical protein